MGNNQSGGNSSFGQGLELGEWEIWHTFSSFLVDAPPALDDVARNLVAFGVAECAITSDGNAWWSTDEPSDVPKRAGYRNKPVGHGLVEVVLRHENSAAEIVLPDVPSGYAQEALYQFAVMRGAELRLLGDGPLPPRYVRAFVGGCILLTREEHPRQLLVYPQIKIFETGVILVEIRMMSPPRKLAAREFIRRFLNAPLAELELVSVPPGVVAWSPDELSGEKGPRWYRRPYVAYLRREHQKAIPGYCVLSSEGDFVFQQTSLSIASDLSLMHEFVRQVLQEQKSLLQESGQEAKIEISTSTDSHHNLSSKKVGSSGRRVKKGKGKRKGRAKRQGNQSGDLPEKDSGTRGAFAAVDAILQANGVDDATRERLGAAWNELRNAQQAPETFHSLALTIMRAAAVVAGSRSTGPLGDLLFSVLGSGTVNSIGSHWRGRPHVHLIRFSEQAERASENEERFGDAFGFIAARIDADDPGAGRRFLPDCSRAFDDYGEYLSEVVALWVHSLSSIRQQEKSGWVDANRGHLVYENQIKAELLEYGYALHRRIAEQSLNANTGTARLLAIQRDLADFEWAVQDTGRFGEVRELLARGWEAFGVGRIRTRIEGALRVRREEAAHRDSVASGRWTALLAGIAGILAVPPVAEAVLAPLWSWRGWPLPANVYAAKLTLVGFAVLGVVAFALPGYWWARRARRFSSGERGKKGEARRF